MTIASWLVVVEDGRGAAVRKALSRPGIECRSEAHGTLVVVTESASAPDALVELHRILGNTPGVRETSLVARYEDEATTALPRLRSLPVGLPA